MQMSWQVYNSHFPTRQFFIPDEIEDVAEYMLNMDRGNGEDIKLPYSHLFVQEKAIQVQRFTVVNLQHKAGRKLFLKMGLICRVAFMSLIL